MAIELNPKNAKAHSSLGAALSKQKQLDEAIAAIQKAIELDPRNAFAWGNLGALLAEQGDLDDAISALRKAIELNPKDATAYGNLGLALNSQKKWDEAIAACRTGIEQLGPHSKLTASIHFQLGKALEGQGNVGETIACFEKAVELDPNNTVFHNALAWVLTNCREVKFRDPQRGLEVARKAVELEPQWPFTWKMLGWAHYRAGDWKASIEALNKSCALQDNPKGGNAYQWFFLAMAHWRLGEQDQARDWHNRAIAWMDANEKDNSDLICFRAEAEVLLELDEQK
jgi:superkiller protein 3